MAGDDTHDCLHTLVLLLCVDIAVALGKLWQCVQRTWWRFNGVGRRLRDIQSGIETVQTAQVLHNWYTIPYNVLTTPYSFITTHDRFVSSKTVLRQNVHLISVEHDVVKFVEVDKDLDIYNLRKNPIFHFAQTGNVRKIIILARREFDALLSGLEDDNREVVWMFHTIRCGSTVWSQIFHSLPNWTVISESQTMFYNVMSASSENNIGALAQTKHYEDQVVATIRMQMRHIPRRQSIFWKAFGIVDDHMVSVLHKRFPKHKLLFAYRDALPNALSFYKAFGKLPRWLSYLKHITSDIDNLEPSGDIRYGRLLYTNGFKEMICHKAITESKLQPNAFEWFTLLWAVKITMFKDFQKEGIDILCLKYDNIRDRPREEIRKVFDYLGIPAEFIEFGVKSMEIDSQDGLFFSRKNREKNADWQMTTDTLLRCNILLNSFRLGDINSVTLMPNTV